MISAIATIIAVLAAFLAYCINDLIRKRREIDGFVRQPHDFLVNERLAILHVAWNSPLNRGFITLMQRSPSRLWARDCSAI